MTTTAEDFRNIAIESLIDAIVTERSEWPPAGWCEQFDAAHSYIPAWACKETHAAFVEHCRKDGPACQHALSHSLRQWLRANDCAELARIDRAVREAYADRHDDPQTWAPYQRVLDEVSDDVPY